MALTIKGVEAAKPKFDKASVLDDAVKELTAKK